MTREVMKEIGNKTREFYEFVLPPVDMRIDDDRLVVIIDLPGFEKKDIRLRIYGAILSIEAKKPDNGENPPVYNQRPNVIDKRIRLPVRVKKGEESVESAKFADGVLTVVIPFIRSGKDISIE